MILTNHTPARRSWTGLALVGALTMGMVACSGGTPEAGSEASVTAGADEAAQAAREADARATRDQLQGMDTGALREAASTAYRESRLYAPAGSNAMEYYLALREREPADPAAASALTDLLPMAVIATEQSRDREDFSEARRLLDLIARTDEAHPALTRLAGSIEAAEASLAQRQQQQEISAEQAAERQRQLEAERARQQQAQQEEAARALAAQEAADREAAERAAVEQREAEQRAAAAAAAEQRAAEQRAAQARAATPPPPAAPVIRPISTPPPRYPAEALRSGQSGEVLVEFTIDTDGSVSNARVVRAEPARVFDREAVAAVRRWRFEPVSEPVTTRRTIGFSPGG